MNHAGLADAETCSLMPVSAILFLSSTGFIVGCQNLPFDGVKGGQNGLEILHGPMRLI